MSSVAELEVVRLLGHGPGKGLGRHAPLAATRQDLGALGVVGRGFQLGQRLDLLPITRVVLCRHVRRERRRVPDAGRGIDTPRDDLIPVGTEGQGDHSRGVSEEGEDVLTGLHVPELQGPIEAGRREPAAVRAEREGDDVGRVPGQGVDNLAARRFADDDRAERVFLAPRSLAGAADIDWPARRACRQGSWRTHCSIAGARARTRRAGFRTWSPPARCRVRR